MPGEKHVEAALLQAQRAVTRDSSWEAALEAVAGLFGCRFAALMAHDPHDGRNLVSVSLNHAPEALAAYRSGAVTDEWAAREQANGTLGKRVARGSWEISPEALKATDFWQACLKPDGLIDVLAIPVASADRALGYVSIHADEARGPFTDEDVELGRRLQPSLTASVTAYVEALRRGHAIDSLAAGLALTGHAAIVLDADRRIVFRCGAAGDMIEDGLFFQVQDNRLAALSQPLEDWLARAVGRAAARSGAADAPPERRVFQAGGRDYAFLVQTLPAQGEAAPAPGCADAGVLILVRPAHAWEDADIAAGAESLGLTPVEAGVAEDLLQGRAAREIAARRGIREATVRWHIKNVLGKSGCCRQLDFVAKMQRLSFPRARAPRSAPYF